MRILVTNKSFRIRGGAELYVRDLVAALLARGHSPVVYTNDPGEVSREIRALTIPVIGDLDAMAEPPDVIHGQDHVQTMTALLRFPATPAVFVCHGWTAWEAAAPRFPRVRRYVAVDDLARERLCSEDGIAADRIRVVLNFVNLARFPPRRPLPARPTRALSLSNYLREDGGLAALRIACDGAGIALDTLGLGVGQVAAKPEAILGDYDVVFAKGRTALEALAVGAAVVVCGTRGLGPLVTTTNLDELRRLNFGIRTAQEAMTADAVRRELARYDAEDATRVAARIRASAGLDAAVDTMVAIYREAIDAERAAGAPDVAAEMRATAAYLRWLTPTFTDVYAADNRAIAAEIAREQLQRRVTALEAERAAQAPLGARLRHRYGLFKYRWGLPVYRRLRALLARQS